MIPVGAIVAGLIVAARLTAREGHRPTRSARGAWMVFLWVIVAPLWLLLTASLVFSDIQGEAARTLAAALLALLPVLIPWALARYLLVPLGLPRAAYWLARTPDWAWMRDPRGGAALAAAWALLRQRTFDPELAAWIERRLADAEHGAARPPLRGAGIVASGLLAAARGDLEAARTLLRSARQIDPWANPPAAKRVAHDWLVADAAARGDWEEVAREGSEPSAGRTARLMALVAERLLRRPDPMPKWRLWLGWVLSSHRFALLPIVRHAIEAECDGAGVSSTATSTIVGADSDGAHSGDGAPSSRRRSDGAVPAFGDPENSWQRALHHHAAVLRAPPTTVSADDLAALGRRWDEALADRAAERRHAERALMLGAVRGERCCRDAFQHDVEADLAAVARQAAVPLCELRAAGGVAAAAATTLRQALLAELELAGTALRARVDEERALAPIDEWREFLALRSSYGRAVGVGGAEVQRLAFSRLKTDVWSYAFWLSSGRGENTLAHSMYEWLLGEARAVGDSRAVEPLSGNVEATAAGDPTARR